MITEFYNGSFITLFYEDNKTDIFHNFISKLTDYASVTDNTATILTSAPEGWEEYNKSIKIQPCSAKEAPIILTTTNGIVIVDGLKIPSNLISSCASKDKRLIVYAVKAEYNIKKYEGYIKKSDVVVSFNNGIEEIVKGHYSPVITPEIYNEEKEKLFAEWKERTKAETPFITDGVMNPELWFSQKVRPLFLLKEAYGGENDWDLVADHVMSNEDIRKIWKRVSLWAKGIFGTDRFHMERYMPNDEEFNEFGNKYLSKIAAVNIKKYDGKEESDCNDILSYAEKDADFLKRQIELCDPTIIVCGYTAASLDKIFGIEVRKETNEKLYYHMKINNHDVLVIDYWHPANQFPEIMNYYGLLGIYQNALNDNNW